MMPKDKKKVVSMTIFVVEGLVIVLGNATLEQSIVWCSPKL